MCLHKQNEYKDDNFPRNLLSGMASSTPQEELENIKADIKMFLEVSKSKQRSTKLTKDDIKANADFLNYTDKALTRAKLRFIRLLKDEFGMEDIVEANRELEDFLSGLD